MDNKSLMTLILGFAFGFYLSYIGLSLVEIMIAGIISGMAIINEGR